MLSYLKAKLHARPQSDEGASDYGQRRIWRVGVTGATTLLARGVTLLVGLLSLPLASRYLGRERFGLWLTLIGLVGWVGLTDLGLGNSLLNALSTAEGKDERERASRIVASAWWSSVAAAVVLLVLFLSLIPLIDWAVIFKVTSPRARAEIRLALVVVLACFVLRMLAGVIASVYAALQEGYHYQLWSLYGGAFSAIGLLAAIKARAGLPVLLGAFIGGGLVGDVLAALFLFGWHRRELLPRLGDFRWAEAKALLRSGGQIWVAQISHIALLQTDLLIVTLLFGARAVAGYGTSLRLYTLVGAIQVAFVAPLWAAYSEALARRDVGWLKQTFKRSLGLSLAWSVPACSLIYWSAPWLFRILVTPDVRPQRDLLLALLVAEIINSIRVCFAMLLNGLGAFRSQVICGPLAGVCNLGLSWWLGQRVGSAGVAWATVICLSVFWIGAMGYDAKMRLSQLPLR
jgi:O-antigen/teichoic acid export membrane protein